MALAHLVPYYICSSAYCVGTPRAHFARLRCAMSSLEIDIMFDVMCCLVFALGCIYIYKYTWCVYMCIYTLGRVYGENIYI